MGRTNVEYPIEKKAEKLLDDLRVLVRLSARQVVRIVDWLVKPNKNMADILQKLAFLLLGASIIFRARGW